MNDFENTSFKMGSENNKLKKKSFNNEYDTLRIEKINQRITLIAVLIPCLIIVIALYIYFDLNDRVLSVHTTESVEIRNLSSDFESKLSIINNDIETLKILYEKNIPEILKKVSSLESYVNVLEKTVSGTTGTLKQIESSKIDKKEIQAIKNEITSTQKDIKQLSLKLSASLDKNSRSYKSTVTQVKKLKESMDGINAKTDQMVTTHKLISQLDIIKNQYDTQISSSNSKFLQDYEKLERENQSLQKKVDQFQKAIDKKDYNVLLLHKKVEDLRIILNTLLSDKNKNNTQDNNPIIEQDIQE